MGELRCPGGFELSDITISDRGQGSVGSGIEGTAIAPNGLAAEIPCDSVHREKPLAKNRASELFGFIACQLERV